MLFSTWACDLKEKRDYGPDTFLKDTNIDDERDRYVTEKMEVMAFSECGRAVEDFSEVLSKPFMLLNEALRQFWLKLGTKQEQFL